MEPVTENYKSGKCNRFVRSPLQGHGCTLGASTFDAIPVKEKFKLERRPSRCICHATYKGQGQSGAKNNNTLRTNHTYAAGHRRVAVCDDAMQINAIRALKSPQPRMLGNQNQEEY